MKKQITKETLVEASEQIDARSGYIVEADKQAQQDPIEALRLHEQQLRMLFEYTSDGIIVVDKEGRYIDANPAACNMLGYRHDELLKQKIPDVLEKDEWPRIAPEINQCSDGTVIRSQWRFRRKDDSIFVGEISASQLPDGRVQAILRDITARQTMDCALHASEERSRLILESITDGFYVLDHNWHFSFINKAGERFLDRNTGDLIGKSLWSEFPGTVGSEFERVYHRVVKTQIGESFTAFYQNFDRWYEVTANPVVEGLSVYFRDITAHRNIEQDREQFAALVEASSDFIGVAALDHRGLYTNRAGQKMTGLRPDQVTSVTVLDFFPKSEHERILPVIADSEDRNDIIMDTYFQHFQTGELIPVSWSFLRRRDTSGNVIGYATVTRDLTEKKKIEKLLKASEEQLRLALDAAELGTWHVNPATRATKTDARYKTIFGTTEEWTDYHQAYAVIHADDLSAVKSAVEAATRPSDPEPYAIEYRIVHADGSVRWIFAKGRATFEGNGPSRRAISFDGTVADVTHNKLNQLERERLVSVLRDADQRKDEFLATLAHELRNPLASLSFGLNILQKSFDTQVTEQVQAMMQRQIEQTVHLIDDLLDVSRISRGQIDLRLEQIDLVTSIRQAIEACQSSVSLAEHTLSLKLPPGPIFVNADLTRMTQVFSNLLNNAAKFTDRGGQIHMTVGRTGSFVDVAIKDNGIGIPAHMLSNIFDMFTQVESTNERMKAGLGIGLSITKNLVEMHGGYVEVSSAGHNMGSEFIVRLPICATTSANEHAQLRQPSSFVKSLRILVVDDNANAAESLSLLLEASGNEIMTSYDGLEAIKAAEMFDPHVILLDIGLPKLNGYEVSRHIRQQDWGKKIIIIALTGYGQNADKSRSILAGFDHHLVKPISFSALEKLLSEVVSEKALIR